MGERTDKNEFSELVAKFLILIIIFWAGCQVGKTDNSRLYNPRKAKDGIDTIYYIDSMFKVKIQIDTAIVVKDDDD